MRDEDMHYPVNRESKTIDHFEASRSSIKLTNLF